MSGICAVWRKENPGRTAATLASLSGGLRLSEEERVRQAADGPAGVAVSARFATQQIYAGPAILVACDAELYNEHDLRALSPSRRAPAEDAPTASLLAELYERLGVDFVEKLQGKFSLVIWDGRQRTLLAAVDGFAINPLVYCQTADALLVASRVDALLKSGEVRAQVNPPALANILNFSSDLGPATILSGVQRLLPGTLLIASEGQMRVRQYWDMRYGLEERPSKARLTRELESVVERAVASHCASGSFAATGAFLSGGTDSSTVVGMMARTERGPVKAFSIGFSEQSFNELEYARITAEKFRAEHYTSLVGPEDCLEALPHMIRYFDEPFGNSSAIPTYFCARLAAQNGVGVLLAGDGGDELFGGNERYATDQIFQFYQRFPGLLRKGLIEPALAALPFQNGLAGKARRYVRRSNLPNPQRMFSHQFLCAHPMAEIFHDDFLKALGDYSVVSVPSRYYSQAPGRDHLDRLLYLDTKITLADNDLPKVTRMSELAGVQARFPFLDRSVAEFSGRIPARWKVKGLEKRYLFKRAFRNLLPAEVIRKKKHGFGIPVSVWMKQDPRMREFSRDTLFSSKASGRGYFRPGAVEDLYRKFERDETTYYGDTLWTFLAIELWHRQVMDQPMPSPSRDREGAVS